MAERDLAEASPIVRVTQAQAASFNQAATSLCDFGSRWSSMPSAGRRERVFLTFATERDLRLSRIGLQGFAVFFLALRCALPSYAWGGKIKLLRKYRPGQSMVYQTKMHTRAQVSSNPPGLASFLPALPTEFSTRQQNTVTVRGIHSDGGVDVENRFDDFEFHSVLPERMPEKLRDSTRHAQDEFSRWVSGQMLTAHYDGQGRLLGFEGADSLLEQLDPPFREPLRQVLRLFLEQMGGNAFYPGHPVRRGEEWKRKLNTPASEQYPFSVDGESILHCSGKTKYRGVKAAVVDFRLTNILTPATESLRQPGPLAQLEALGLKLDIRVDGQGQGRMLVALEDGRILQNHATLNETLSARLQGHAGAFPLPSSKPVTLTINSETSLEVGGSGKKGR